MEKPKQDLHPLLLLGMGFFLIGLVAIGTKKQSLTSEGLRLMLWPVLGVLDHSLPLGDRLGMLVVVISSGLYLCSNSIPVIMINTLGMLTWAIGVVYLG